MNDYQFAISMIVFVALSFIVMSFFLGRIYERERNEMKEFDKRMRDIEEDKP